MVARSVRVFHVGFLLGPGAGGGRVQAADGGAADLAGCMT